MATIYKTRSVSNSISKYQRLVDFSTIAAINAMITTRKLCQTFKPSERSEDPTVQFEIHNEFHITMDKKSMLVLWRGCDEEDRPVKWRRGENAWENGTPA